MLDIRYSAIMIVIERRGSNACDIQQTKSTSKLSSLLQYLFRSKMQTLFLFQSQCCDVRHMVNLVAYIGVSIQIKFLFWRDRVKHWPRHWAYYYMGHWAYFWSRKLITKNWPRPLSSHPFHYLFGTIRGRKPLHSLWLRSPSLVMTKNDPQGRKIYIATSSTIQILSIKRPKVCSTTIFFYLPDLRCQ